MLLKQNTFNKKKFIFSFSTTILCWIIILSSIFFDSLIAGNLIGAEAVAGIELATPVQYVYVSIAMLFSFSFGILYARESGKHNKEQSYKIAGMAVITSLGASVIIGVIIYIAAPMIIGLYDCSPVIREYAITYLRNCTFSFPFFFLYNCFYYLATYDGDDTVLLAADVVCTISMMVCPYLLAVKYGFKGISLANILIYFIACLVATAHFFSKHNSIHFKPYFSFEVLKKEMRLSSTNALVNIYIALVDLVFNALIVKYYGDAMLNAYTVVNLVIGYAEITVSANWAGQAFISTCYGEGSIKSIRSLMKLVVKSAVILGVIVCVILEFVAPCWPTLFAIDNPIVAKNAIFAGRVIPLGFVCSAFVYTFINYYPIVNKSLYGNIVALLYMLVTPLVICIPLASISFNAMSVGFALTPVATVIIMLIFFVVIKNKDYLCLPKSRYKEYHYDIYLTDESITEVKDAVLDELKVTSLDSNIVNELSVVIEDSLEYIKDENTKKVLAEVTILFDNKNLHLIIKDDGKIFDLIEAISHAKSLRAYTIDRLIDSAYEKESDVAVSFDRNVFSWKLNS